MKKIDPNNDVCADYELNTRAFKEALSKGASVRMFCGSCLYNLFTYCQFEDKDDPIVIRALEGSDDAKIKILNNIRSSEETQEPTV